MGEAQKQLNCPDAKDKVVFRLRKLLVRTTEALRNVVNSNSELRQYILTLPELETGYFDDPRWKKYKYLKGKKAVRQAEDLALDIRRDFFLEPVSLEGATIIWGDKK